MMVLVDRLEASSTPSDASCFTPVGCPLPGTEYEVSIQTPSPSHIECDPERCIQVRIRQPSFGLTFARIFGFEEWEVSSTSVAGILQTRQYGLVTLRPPDPRNGMRNRDDISISGGSKVAVGGADVATNTNVVCDGSASGSELRLEAGFRVYHWDVGAGWLAPPGECFNPPQGTQLTSPLTDPDYDIPQRGALTAGCPTTSSTICTYVDSNLDDAKLTTAECDALISSGVIPPQYAVVPADTTCYKPGIYTRTLTVSANTDFAVADTRRLLLRRRPRRGRFPDRGLSGWPTRRCCRISDLPRFELSRVHGKQRCPGRTQRWGSLSQPIRIECHRSRME